MKSPTKWPRLLLLVPLAVYLLLPNRNFYWDGVAFAIAIEKQAPLRETLHPSHLLYIPFGVWLYGAAAAIGLKVRALFLLQTVNSLLAGASVALVYRALRRRDLDDAVALAGALAFAFAATWWKFATDANAYIPAILLILCANDLLERHRSPFLVAAACCAAMLVHELAIFYLLVACCRAERRRDTATLAAVALLPVATAYWMSWRIVSGDASLAGIAGWAVRHSPDSAFSFRPLANLGWTLLGSLRVFFGGKPGAVLAVAFAGIPAFSRPRRDAAVWLWLSVYVVFLFFWMPQNTFYRLFYLTPLILLAVPMLRRSTLPLAAILALWNGAFLVLPESRAANNPPLHFALEQHARWPPGVPIVFHRFHPDLWTISYFNQQAAWIGFLERDYGLLDRHLTAARALGQPLWIDGTAYDFLAADPSGRQWLAQHQDPAGGILFRERGREFRFYAMR